MIESKVDLIREAQRVLQTQGQMLLQAAERLGSEVQHAASLMLNATKIVVLGIGKSGLVGQKIAATLCSTGTPAVFLHAAEALHGDLGVYTPGDPTILISKSGATAELVRLIPMLRDFQSPLIGILGNMKSVLAMQVDVVLDATVLREADPLGIAPTTSATLAMALGDALASVLMIARNFNKEDFARFHPAGQLGRNLLSKVADVMQPMDRVAQVGLQSSLREVVIMLSQYPLGGACVINEQGNLEGFITDGDIRRALKMHEDIRGLHAIDLMTAEPVCTFPNISIDEAVRQMEDRPSQIYVLPVVEANSRRCVGLLRLHDVYQPQLL